MKKAGFCPLFCVFCLLREGERDAQPPFAGFAAEGDEGEFSPAAQGEAIARFYLFGVFRARPPVEQNALLTEAGEGVCTGESVCRGEHAVGAQGGEKYRPFLRFARGGEGRVGFPADDVRAADAGEFFA